MKKKDLVTALRNGLDGIRHELASGVHTYHACKCGNSTRSGLCASCRVEELLEMSQKEKAVKG